MAGAGSGTSGIAPSAGIAESIETLDQAKACQALGATLGQGYHFGRPVPIRDVLDA